MQRRSLGYAIAVVQSFALFVAISIFLGRVYYITYYETLGIPVSEMHPTPIDYTIVSPDVTILGIGITLLAVGLVWLGRSYGARHWGLSGSLVGALMFILGNFMDLIPFEQQSQLIGPGKLGLWELLQIALMMTGAFLFSSGFAFAMNKDQGNNAGKASKTSAFRIPVLMLAIILFAFLLVYLITSSSSNVARIDATITLEESPQVFIEFKKGILSSPIDNEVFACKDDANVCMFGLILVSGRFVYVQSLDPDDETMGRSIYSFPIDDIAQMAYVVRSAER